VARVRRTPLKRRARLSRTTRLRPRRTAPRRSSRVRDPEYMARVAALPCLLAGEHVCDGRIEVHHMGSRGLGQKCSDLETVPFCQKAHREWHDASGYFRGLTREDRREYAAHAIAETRRRIDAR
jgi:hypothetical protein